MIKVTHDHTKVIFTGAKKLGWWDNCPRLALYLAADMDENSGTPGVHERLDATHAEMVAAEKELAEYPLSTVYDMGYYKLLPMENRNLIAATICGRLY